MLTPLDQIAISIELTLISVIEGVALYFLAQSSISLLSLTGGAAYLLFALAGFLFLLMFWAQALLHAVSFIRWPIHTGHMFLYFAAALVQAVAYSQLTNPIGWFASWLTFSLIVAVLYVADLGLIQDAYPSFAALEGGEAYLARLARRHRLELSTLVPLAVFCNVAALGAFLYFPELAGETRALVLVGALQCMTALGALVDATRNFRTRGNLLSLLLKK